MSIPVRLNKESGVPFYVQLEEQFRLLIHNGTLARGESLPTVRALAVELRINSNTVARVYRDLQNEGVLVLKRGIGTFVSEDVDIEVLSKSDRQSIEKKVDSLIVTARQLFMSSDELFQLIETRWKENSDV